MDLRKQEKAHNSQKDNRYRVYKTRATEKWLYFYLK